MPAYLLVFPMVLELSRIKLFFLALFLLVFLVNVALRRTRIVVYRRLCFGGVGAPISFALREILLFALIARKYLWIGHP